MTRTFCSDHDNPQDSQLIICITGSPAGIEQAIKNIQRGSINWPKDYKPVQGTSIGADATVSIITPIWKGEEY